MFSLSNFCYILLLIEAFIIGYIVTRHKIFNPMWIFLYKYFPNKKLIILIVSSVLGSLPVPGRIVLAAPMLKSYINHKDKLGVFNFVATHHYYFWSPLEKSIIIILGGLSISYMQFMSYIWPLLLVYLIYVVMYTLFYLDYQDINDFMKDEESKDRSSAKLLIPFILFIISLGLSVVMHPVIPFTILTLYYVFISSETFNNCIKSIDWKIVLLVLSIMVIANLIKSYVQFPESYNLYSIILILLSGFVFSFLLGSSSRYAGITVIITLALGLKYLPLVFAIEYMGYFLSPFHKCVPISIGYFHTKISHFYKHVTIISSSLVVTGLCMFFL